MAKEARYNQKDNEGENYNYTQPYQDVHSRPNKTQKKQESRNHTKVFIIGEAACETRCTERKCVSCIPKKGKYSIIMSETPF